VSLGVQERGDGRRIDAAGHGYGDGVRMRHRATRYDDSRCGSLRGMGSMDGMGESGPGCTTES
jgi:hypothetical protein